MFFRLSVLLIVLFSVLAACSGAPAATPAPTVAPTSASQPTPLPPTLVPTMIPPTETPQATNVPATLSANENAPLLTPAPEPREIAFGKSYLGVHYCTDGTTPLKMNIVTPKELGAPAAILLHLKFQPQFIRPFVEKGFIVGDVDWREPPTHKLPIGVQDVKCAIRYLRAHASQYNLDPDKIGVFGCSRGGHMGALVGVTDPSAGMDGDFGFPNESSRVQAVAMFDGIANFKTNYADAAGELNEIHGISSFDDPQIARLSPITYATQDDPPFLIIASDSDGWKAQAKEIKSALDAQGVPATVIEAEGATHCNFAAGGPHTQERMIEILTQFFEQTLQ